ncbi:MAG TPA: DNA translocase FtsK [Blastocatellia bacterium]|nr:DNA translocase FtsK [Blastocatellia bacterium]
MSVGTSTVAHSSRSRLDEVLGILCLFFSLVLALSLVSYDPGDPSWNTATSKTSASNWIGIIGAHLADLLLQTLGLVAFALPVILLVVGWSALRSRSLRASLLKVIGWLGLMTATSGLLTLLSVNERLWWRSVRPGGFFGLIVTESLTSALNVVGTALTLGTIFLLALMVVGNISFVGATEGLAQRIAHLRERGRLRREVLSVSEESAEEEPLLNLLTGKKPPKVPEPKIAGGEETRPMRTAQSTATSEPEETSKAPALVGASAVDSRAAETLATTDKSRRAPTRSGAPDLELEDAVGRSRVAPLPVDIEDVIESSAGPLTVGKPLSSRPTATLRSSPAEDEVAEMLSTASVKTVKPVEKAKVERRPAHRASENFILPSPDMLTEPPPPREQAREELMQRAIILAEKCKEFAVTGHVHQISPGPVVTTFEFKPDPGIKYSRITSLVDDLCLALEAESIRIDRIPGKSTVGIEVPNKHRELIYLRELIESRKFQESRSRLTIALGKTIDGNVYITDLAKMPHLLIAGATGSGKSMTVNCIITSILYKATPSEVKFILIDPKRLELGLYEDIPYLLAPIVTDPKRASYALKWAVAEMENRYKLLASFGVRNIEQFNREVREGADRSLTLESGEPVRPLPYIVIVIDELADLMMVASSEVETAITRLAQMARAVGIHLVLTTQRPSVDVITGLIKANFPCRIAFRVSSKVDSRTIIDVNGAEALLGKGDMLFLPPGSARLVRVHGGFIEEKEIKRIVEFLKSQAQPEYDETVLMSEKEYEAAQSGGGQKYDELYEDALRIVIQMGRASTSVLQRRLRIGYGRAASIIDMMERDGFVEPADGPRPRAITRKALEFRERLEQMREDQE